MPILRVKQTWKKPPDNKRKPPGATERLDRLGPEQEANVRAAMSVLKIRYGGSWDGVARAIRAHSKNIERIMRGGGRATAGLAIRVAVAAGVPVDDVLSGAFPKPGSCPMCGRCD